MKKILSFALCSLISIGATGAVVRDNNSVNRQTNTVTAPTRVTSAQIKSDRAINTRTAIAPAVARETSARSNATVSRNATVVRSAQNINRTATTGTSNARSATTTTRNTVRKAKSSTTARATTTNIVSKTFGTGYNLCRDAYFTCMDQFCATANDTYRRCVCSSRLEEIKTKERALSQTGQQLQDFKDLNIDAISKSSEEVKAMLTASAGEKAAANAKDKSSSAQQLAGISAVLQKTKSQALSTQGKLDIAGDINAIWATTDLAASADLMNLTGEKLYNAVHAQCVEFARESCESESIVTMVVSAYGMYIENDCSNLSNALAKKITEASGAIRGTEREMNLARLENYDAHNSTSINDCIAQVRKDITSANACGPDYVHCLDITGKYLKRDTGEPIYSANFYQLEMQTSLSGDVLSNQINRMLIIELNNKKEFAKRGLDTCRDLSDDVWEEFMRQAIVEIYQGQQARIRQVKNECIDVVNDCYDTQNKSLKDFSNIKEQLLLGARLELSEQMCKEKLDACSNLYGGGETGLRELVDTMQSITDQKIAKDCKIALEEYAMDICMVPSSDIVHAYPFACRTYAPGEQKYATNPDCNVIFTNDNGTGGGSGSGSGGEEEEPPTSGYNCPALKKYNRCNPGYYMTFGGVYNPTPQAGNKCTRCPTGSTCAGGDAEPIADEVGDLDCGRYYIGSLYQKIVRYALQTCIRPSKQNEVIPTTVLEDVNVVMDSIKVAMGKELSNECQRLGGMWVDTPGGTYDSNGVFNEFPVCNGTSTDPSNCLFKKFYEETSADKKWGYCKPLE